MSFVFIQIRVSRLILTLHSALVASLSLLDFEEDAPTKSASILNDCRVQVMSRHASNHDLVVRKERFFLCNGTKTVIMLLKQLITNRHRPVANSGEFQL